MAGALESSAEIRCDERPLARVAYASYGISLKIDGRELSEVPCNTTLVANAVEIAAQGVKAKIIADGSEAPLVIRVSPLNITIFGAAALLVKTVACDEPWRGRYYVEMLTGELGRPSEIRLVILEGGSARSYTYAGGLLERALKNETLSVPPAQCYAPPLELPSVEVAAILLVEWSNVKAALVLLPQLAPQPELYFESTISPSTIFTPTELPPIATVRPNKAREVPAGEDLIARALYASSILAGALVTLMACRRNRELKSNR
ncbi:MAG: hypothetical protein QXU97_01985 [Fervidicoccaceae archaeon]